MIALLMEVMLRTMPNVYRFKNNILTEDGSGFEILILGNSHSYFGFNPVYFSRPGFNAGHVSQTYDYDLEILRRFTQDLSSLEYIVLPVSSFSFYERLSSSKESWRIKDYCLYYKIRTSDYLPHYTEVLNGELAYKIRKLWTYYAGGKDNIDCTRSGWGTAYRISKPIDLEHAGESAAQRHFRSDERYFNEVSGILDSLIVFAGRNQVKVLLITTPACRTYRENLNAKQLERIVFTARLKDQNYNNCKYYNLLESELFTAGDFYDADHLNEKGAMKLTAWTDSILYRSGLTWD
jgi:hypothetical protein